MSLKPPILFFSTFTLLKSHTWVRDKQPWPSPIKSIRLRRISCRRLGLITFLKGVFYYMLALKCLPLWRKGTWLTRLKLMSRRESRFLSMLARVGFCWSHRPKFNSMSLFYMKSLFLIGFWSSLLIRFYYLQIMTQSSTNFSILYQSSNQSMPKRPFTNKFSSSQHTWSAFNWNMN